MKMKTFGTPILFLSALHTFLFLPLVPLMAEPLEISGNDMGAKPFIVHEGFKESIVPGDPLSIEATVTDNVGGEEVTLFYRSVGESKYAGLAMRSTGENTYAIELPKHVLNAPGLEYYIQAFNGSGKLALLGFANTPRKVHMTLRKNKRSLGITKKMGWGTCSVAVVVAEAVGGGGGITTGSALVSSPTP